MGSSPLARGTHGIGCTLEKCRGLIPARAGNTRTFSPSHAARWAHPRSRGEHPYKPLRVLLMMGSSPLARGTLRIISIPRARVGLIPARAGNTGIRRLHAARIRAHPRSRGEHPSPGALEAAARGSSPLARGTPITWSLSRFAAVAHPRSRGEHFDEG